MPIITAIEAQKKKKDRANLYLDGRFFCGMQSVTLLSAGLKVGDEIEEDYIENLLLSSETDVAFQKALTQISTRMRSKKEIETYLLGKGFLKKVVDATTTKLEEYGYVCDAEFAKEFVRCNAKLGQNALRQKLRQKGIAESIAESVASCTQQEEEEKAKKLAQKYVSTRQNAKNLNEKLFRHLISKGFSVEIAKSVVAKVTNFEGDEYYEN